MCGSLNRINWEGSLLQLYWWLVISEAKQLKSSVEQASRVYGDKSVVFLAVEVVAGTQQPQGYWDQQQRRVIQLCSGDSVSKSVP